MDIGAVELLVVGFPENRFTGAITPALLDLVDKGTIRVVDLIFVGKDDDGAVVAFELTSLDDDIRRAFESLVTAPEQLLHDDDISDVGEALEPGSSAALILFEHAWAHEFRKALTDAGGELIDSFRIAPETIADARAALGQSQD